VLRHIEDRIFCDSSPRGGLPLFARLHVFFGEEGIRDVHDLDRLLTLDQRGYGSEVEELELTHEQVREEALSNVLGRLHNRSLQITHDPSIARHPFYFRRLPQQPLSLGQLVQILAWMTSF